MSEQPIPDIFKALNERDVPTMMAWVKHPHVCTTSVERNVILLLGADLLSLRSAYEELRDLLQDVREPDESGVDHWFCYVRAGDDDRRCGLCKRIDVALISSMANRPASIQPGTTQETGPAASSTVGHGQDGDLGTHHAAVQSPGIERGHPPDAARRTSPLPPQEPT